MKHIKTKQLNLLIVLIAALLVITQMTTNKTDKLAVINPIDIDPELVDQSLHTVNADHRVSDFELINQNGETITQEAFKNKIYIVDFFFTSCPTICPVMFNNMGKIQDKFIDNDNIMLLSLSVTPEIDSVPRLRQYASNKGVIDSKWHVTTGDKKHIYDLARKSYFATTDEGDGGLQDFIHTSNFILVDEKRQIRGIYNGVEDKEIDRLINDIQILNE